MPQALPTFISDRVLESRYFFLNLRPASDARLAVVCGGREACGPNYRIDRVRFPYFALEYVARGEGTLRVHGHEHPLRAGSVFAYQPNMPHHIASSDARPLVKYFVDFAGRGARPLLEEADLASGTPRQLIQSRWFGELFEQMIEAGGRVGSFAPRHCRLLLEALISRLTIDARNTGQSDSPAYETYARCRLYAEQHFHRLSTAAAWARACHLDQAYLSRLFKRFSDQKPYQFLQHLKMGHAADLLVGGASVKEAAHAVGFADPQHFSRVFKRIHGVSPMDFLRLTTRRPAIHQAGM